MTTGSPARESAGGNSGLQQHCQHNIRLLEDSFVRMSQAIRELGGHFARSEQTITASSSRIDVLSRQIRTRKADVGVPLQIGAEQTDATSGMHVFSTRYSDGILSPSSRRPVPRNLKDSRQMWKQLKRMLQNRQLTDAYRQVLEFGDDVLLVRLMRETGTDAIEELQEPFSLLLVARCIHFLKIREFIDIALLFMEKAFDLQTSLSLQQCRMLERALFALSAPTRGASAEADASIQEADAVSDDSRQRAAELRAVLLTGLPQLRAAVSC